MHFARVSIVERIAVYIRTANEIAQKLFCQNVKLSTRNARFYLCCVYLIPCLDADVRDVS